MEIKFQEQFWYNPADPASRVFVRVPPVFKDNRGSFSEVLKHGGGRPDSGEWYSDMSWIKQINRSVSKPGVARGLHAQAGQFCQGKLVQSVHGRIFDVIMDARPDSNTFGSADVFLLDSETQNQVWVPRGFLHGFVVPRGRQGNVVFEYFCDNVYDRQSEIGIAPQGVLRSILRVKGQEDSEYDIDEFELSEKDIKGFDYMDWMSARKKEYEKEGMLWYR